MKVAETLRQGWYHLTLPVRLSHWLYVIRLRTNQLSCRPCQELPDDVVCILYRTNLWTRPKAPSDMDVAIRTSIAFEIVERFSEGNRFVAEFCTRNSLPVLWPLPAP